MSEPWVADSLEISETSAAAKASTRHTYGGQFPDPSLSAQTTPTRLKDDIRRFEHIYETAFSELTCQRHSDGGLKVVVRAGNYRKPNNDNVAFSETTLDCTDNTTGLKIWINIATNTLAQGATWPLTVTDFFPIAELNTSGGAVVDGTIRSRRELVAFWMHSAVAAITGTDSAEFTLDADNVGPGAVQLNLRFNRGTSGEGEDAGIQWDENVGRIRILAKVDSESFAETQVGSLRIGSLVVLDTGGELAPAGIGSTKLYTFGPNGSSQAGLQIAPAASPGPPIAGAHAPGEIHSDSDNVPWICTVAGTPGTWVKLGDHSFSFMDKLVQVSVGDANGASPQDASVQVLDRQGNALNQEVLLIVGVYQDSDGGADATNATIGVQVGTDVRDVVATKTKVIKTNPSGLATIRVTNGVSETVYLRAAPAPGSPHLDCSDLGTVTIV